MNGQLSHNNHPMCGGAVASCVVSALSPGSSGPGSCPGRGRDCVVFLGKTLYSHSASLHPGVLICTGELNPGGNRAMD